jgi:hypothetical protein
MSRVFKTNITAPNITATTTLYTTVVEATTITSGSLNVSTDGVITLNSSAGQPMSIDASTGQIQAATGVIANYGNVDAWDYYTPLPTTTTAIGNVRAVNQIITASTASDSIKTSGGVTTGSVTASGNITAASATLTSGFSTAGVVHNNTSGVLSSSLITNADVSASAAIAQSKLALQKYMTLTDSTVDVLPRYACNTSRVLASGSVYFTAYTPEKTITVSSISLSNQVVCVPISGTNKFQVGIFTASGTVPTSVTCVSFSKKERTTTTTTPAAFGSVLSGTLETFALGYTITNGGSPATNGAPTSVTLTAGTTYWIGIVGYASAGFTTGASVMGITVNTYQVDPYIGLSNTITSTDFAVSTAVSATPGSTSFPWFRLS